MNYESYQTYSSVGQAVVLPCMSHCMTFMLEWGSLRFASIKANPSSPNLIHLFEQIHCIITLETSLETNTKRLEKLY